MHFPYHSFLIAEFFVSPFDFVLNWYYNNTEKENNGDHAMTKTTKQPLQERLLQAGVEELYQHGIENFSVRRIATACGVSCAAPYKHFSDKNAFVAAIFDHVNNQWLALEENLLTAEGTPREKLLKVCTAYVRFLVDNPNFRTIMMMAAQSFDAEFRFQRTQLTHKTFALVEEYCDSVCMSPEVKRRKLYVARSLVYGAALLFDNGALEMTEENLNMVISCIDREFDLP